MSHKHIHCQLPASLRAILNCIVSAGHRSLGRLEIAPQLLYEPNKLKKNNGDKKTQKPVLCHLNNQSHSLRTAEIVIWCNRSVETELLFHLNYIHMRS